MKTTALSTRLPSDLAQQLDDVCAHLGYRKSALIEQALREKLEDLLDARDLREGLAAETRYSGLDDVRGTLLDD